MVAGRSFTDAGRALVFLLLYGSVASALATRFGPYPRVLAALLASVAVFAAVDVLSAFVQGNRPVLDADSRLYSVRGLVVLILLVLVTAVTADWLRQVTALSEILVTLAGFLVGVAVVLGPIAIYYWRGSVSSHAAS